MQQLDSIMSSGGSLFAGKHAAAAGGVLDQEAMSVTGRDPTPKPGATCRAAHPSRALWVTSATPPVGGILLVSGVRSGPGLLSRQRYSPGELVKAAAALPGAVLTPADPGNLEPETHRAYAGEPHRHPGYMVQCYKPFNGETPHQLLADKFVTPPELFYVRNHLPVPTQLKAEGYCIELSGPCLSPLSPASAEAKQGPGDAHSTSASTTSTTSTSTSPGKQGYPGTIQLSLADLKAGKWGPVLQQQAVLQCAGNRRSEMCAVKLVEGRAPWNHGEAAPAAVTEHGPHLVLSSCCINYMLFAGTWQFVDQCC